MIKHSILAVTLLLLFRASAVHAGYFFYIDPPNGGPSIPVGPYKSYGDCADTLGSALYSHPFACHLHWSPNNCRIIGNGFAYPSDFPYPVPPDLLIPVNEVFNQKKGPNDLKKGWYFLFYTATGGSIEKCSQLKKFEELASQIPGDEVPAYRNMNCPGAPCFSVGFDTACN